MINIKKSKFYIPIIAAVAVLLLVSLNGMPAAKENPARMIPVSFSQLAEKARPGVVNIRTVKTIKGGGRVFRHFFGNPFGERNPFRDFFGPFSEREPSRDFKQRSLGSGFIIDREGYIVTNNHVIENADQIKVKLSNAKEYDAELVGRDPNTDLALIKIKDDGDLTPLAMGDSDSLPVGTWVVAIGSPFGLEQTVTAGIVSAKGRIIGSGPYDDFIQTDASINPGNSGGPLLNMQGKVVGINTAIVASGQGIGFAIPINLAKGIIDQLKSKGEVTRGWLGVGIQDLTPELAEYYGVREDAGVLVTRVFEGDPADKGGIKPNDIIVSVNGNRVTSARELSGLIADIGVGQRASIELIRDGRKKTIDIETAKRQDDRMMAGKEPQEPNGQLGLMLQALDRETARRFGYEADEKGVLITGVQPGSKADSAGFRQGDLIKEVNRTPVKTADDLRTEYAAIEDGDSVRMLLKRGRAGFLALTFIK
ncbi:MAG: DegQ family serine endoprotease [Desulfobacterales bacterium]|jgi:serine protease Do